MRVDVEVATGLQRGREFNRLAEARDGDDEAIAVTSADVTAENSAQRRHRRALAERAER